MPIALFGGGSSDPDAGATVGRWIMRCRVFRGYAFSGRTLANSGVSTGGDEATDGRWIMRGRVFRGRAFATWAMANGGVDASSALVDGWISESRSRLLISQPRDRVWIARER